MENALKDERDRVDSLPVKKENTKLNFQNELSASDKQLLSPKQFLSPKNNINNDSSPLNDLPPFSETQIHQQNSDSPALPPQLKDAGLSNELTEIKKEASSPKEMKIATSSSGLEAPNFDVLLESGKKTKKVDESANPYLDRQESQEQRAINEKFLKDVKNSDFSQPLDQSPNNKIDFDGEI